ncbi:MAG: hypothetical protein M3P37_06690 [Actinomycetota bacterium]|jgi:hypothetical protein|nr:hypothetical protein [Actinomycetota bacterium]
MERDQIGRIPDRWIGEPVEVGHHVDNAGVLSVGSSAGTLEETDDAGILVSVQGSGGSVELRFFPWTSVVTISTSVG